jgi:hypothetical protein
MNRVIERVVAWSIAAVFLASGMQHLRNPYFFLGSVYSYEIVGSGCGVFIASTLPFLQLVLGVCLLADVARRAALSITCAVFGLFLCVQGWAWWQNLGIECGCFGANDDLGRIGLTSMVVPLGGVLLAGVGIAFRRGGDLEAHGSRRQSVSNDSSCGGIAC